MLVSYEADESVMRLAISEAKKAREAGDYAIGAAIIFEGRVVASSGNRVKLDGDPTQHAEVAAIRKACSALGLRHLPGAILYTTAEPCPMCAAAAIWARLDGIVSEALSPICVSFESASAPLSGPGERWTLLLEKFWIVET